MRGESDLPEGRSVKDGSPSVGAWVSANRLGQVTGPVAATALASGAGERATYLVGAAMMATVGLVWRPVRRTVGRVVDNCR